MIQHLYVSHDIIQYKALDLWCLMCLEQIKVAICQPILHEMLIQLYSSKKKKKKEGLVYGSTFAFAFKVHLKDTMCHIQATFTLTSEWIM